MRVEVQTYSGFTADERPVRFQMSGRDYEVQELLDKWYGPDDTWYKVLAEGGIYILRLNPTEGWTLESFRAAPLPKEQDSAPPG